MSEKKEYQVTDSAGKLAKGFLRNPLTAVLGAFLLIMGYLALNIMPREEDPQIAISGGAVIVAMPGATPAEVENIIINPLERKLREVKGIEHVYGMAMDNVGIVNVMYYIGENREDSNLKLYDKVMQNMDMMPKGVMQPLIKPFDIDIDIPIKVEGPADVAEVDNLLSHFERKAGMEVGSIFIDPGLETAQSIRQSYEIATASPRVAHMGGSGGKGGDTSRSIGFQWTPEGLETLYLKSKVLFVDLRCFQFC